MSWHHKDAIKLLRLKEELVIIGLDNDLSSSHHQKAVHGDEIVNQVLRDVKPDNLQRWPNLSEFL